MNDNMNECIIFSTLSSILVVCLFFSKFSQWKVSLHSPLGIISIRREPFRKLEVEAESRRFMPWFQFISPALTNWLHRADMVLCHVLAQAEPHKVLAISLNFPAVWKRNLYPACLWDPSWRESVFVVSMAGSAGNKWKLQPDLRGLKELLKDELGRI